MLFLVICLIFLLNLVMNSNNKFSLQIHNQAIPNFQINYIFIHDYLTIIKDFSIGRYKLDEHEADVVCRLLYDYLYRKAIAQPAMANSLYIRFELSYLVSIIHSICFSEFDRDLRKVAIVCGQIAKDAMNNFAESLREQFKASPFSELAEE